MSTHEGIARIRLHPAVVAIDGPAASGKSTIGTQLAREVEYLFFDTGVMYRAVTVAALEAQLDVYDNDSVGALAERIEVDVQPPTAEHHDGRLSTVLVDGVDVTAQIRSAAVDQAVSPVSIHQRVREELTRQQRRIGLHYGAGHADMAGVVMVGRDIGTVVLPEAPVKIYLDATPEERASRRHAELLQKAVTVAYADVLADLVRRDGIDSGREIAPLLAADDAVVLDTTDLTPRQVVDAIIAVMRQAASG